MWLLITHLRACPLLDYSIKIHLDVVIGSLGCIFSSWKNLGIALKNAFQQKDQMWYQYLVAICFYPIWQNSLPFLSQDSFDSPVSLFVWLGFFCLLQSFQTKQNKNCWYDIVFHNHLVFWFERELKLRALTSLISWVLFCAWDSANWR